MNRRNFLRTTGAATAAMALSPSSNLFALEPNNAYRRNIGIQLYTLRNQINEDVAGTLQRVAAAGYQQVELYGFPNADSMASAAKEAGLAVNSSHFEWDSVVDPKDDALSNFARILDKAKGTGLSQLVIPYLRDGQRRNLDDYKKVAANSNKAAEMAKAVGIQLSYHNHNFEFLPMEGGKSGFDIFVEEFSPEMAFELDVFWVKAGGLDPVALIKKLRGRVTQLHLKDLKEGLALPTYSTGVPKDSFQELGDGIISMEPILVAAEKAGVAHCHVEQDQSPDPLASIRKSMDYLNML